MAYAQYLPLSAIPYSCSMSASLSIYLPRPLWHIPSVVLQCSLTFHFRPALSSISARYGVRFPLCASANAQPTVAEIDSLSNLSACPSVWLSVCLPVFLLPSVRLSISQPGVACQAWVSELWHLRGLRSESFRFRLWLQSWLHLSTIPTPPAPCIVLPVRKLCLPPFPISFADSERICAHLSYFRVCPVCLSVSPCASTRVCVSVTCFWHFNLQHLIQYIFNLSIACNTNSRRYFAAFQTKCFIVY